MIFDDYPEGGRKLLDPEKGTNSRHEYGPAFMRKTGQTKCAYCGVDFTAKYETWLTMVLDHVVPVNVCNSIGAEKWRDDSSNIVLSCAACNGFCNRYKPPVDIVQPLTLEAFYKLRDQIFGERHNLIAARHKSERAFFETRPWQPSTVKTG
jgi:hypothetical protein